MWIFASKLDSKIVAFKNLQSEEAKQIASTEELKAVQNTLIPLADSISQRQHAPTLICNLQESPSASLVDFKTVTHAT